MYQLIIKKTDAHKAAGVLLANLGSCDIVHGEEENSTVSLPDAASQERALQAFTEAGIMVQD